MNVLLLVALSAVSREPVPVGVIAWGESDDLAAAAALHEQLRRDPRLSLAGKVLTAQTGGAEPFDPAPLTALAEAARIDYDALKPDGALEKLGRLQNELSTQLNRPEAVLLLSRALRLRGLVQLYVGDRTAADAAFVAAYFLDEEFSPASGEWPPEARLAYADAVAACRRRAAGVLSLRVEPAVATVWLDGKRLGVGPMTIPELPPGQHVLLALAPGHQPVAAVIAVAGEGKLDSASLFLEPRSEVDPLRLHVDALTGALGREGEQAVAAGLAAHLGVRALVVVTAQQDGGPPAAHVFDAAGARQDEPVELRSAERASPAVIGRLLGESGDPGVTPPTPWYRSWWTWGIAGAVVAVAGTAAIVAAAGREEPDRIRFVIGRAP